MARGSLIKRLHHFRIESGRDSDFPCSCLATHMILLLDYVLHTLVHIIIHVNSMAQEREKLCSHHQALAFLVANRQRSILSALRAGSQPPTSGPRPGISGVAACASMV